MALAVAFWPGVPMYDTVSQYDQVQSDDVTDWHPPVMVRLWQLLAPLGSGTEPMFVLQVALYASGFALIVAALVRVGRPIAAASTGVLAISPLLFGWQMIVLKDAQMLGAMIASFGIVAHYRLSVRNVPIAAGAAVALLLVYATLVRANALFSTVPLTLLILPRPRSVLVSGLAAVAVILLLLAIEPVINHRVFGASPSGIEKSQPLFDLAAIAAATPASVPPFTHAERDQLVRKHCVKSFFWDPLGDPRACGPVTDRANGSSDRELYIDLARAAFSHPLPYAAHRLKHWNSTDRWLVRPNLMGAVPPEEAEPNDEGLTTPRSRFVAAWQSVAAWEEATPVGWPITWTVTTLLVLPIAWRRRGEAGADLAFALIVSALTLEASFIVISIASDLRYHLWPMTASPLGLILLSDSMRLRAAHKVAAAGLLAIVITGGIASRDTLAPAPDSYQSMLVAPIG